MSDMFDRNIPDSARGGPPGSAGASSINAAADAIKAGNPPPELADAIRHGYEPHDINLRAIYIFLGALAATLVVALVIVAGVMKGLLVYDQAVDPLSSPAVIDRRPAAIPLQPSLSHDQVDRKDMDNMRAHVQTVLGGQGKIGDRRWIPIQQAMEQVLPMLPIGPGAGASGDTAPANTANSNNPS